MNHYPDWKSFIPENAQRHKIGVQISELLDQQLRGLNENERQGVCAMQIKVLSGILEMRKREGIVTVS